MYYYVTVETYMVIICQQSYFGPTIIWYSITHSLFHSRLKTSLFCKSVPPQPFLFFFGTHFMDSADCSDFNGSITIGTCAQSECSIMGRSHLRGAA